MRASKDFSYYTYEQDFINTPKVTKSGGLCWNVLVEDINAGKIIPYNIFDHYSFMKSLIINNKQFSADDQFFEHVVRDIKYYFWSKAEWEIVVTDWPTHVTMKELDRLNAEREKYTNDYNREPYCLSVDPKTSEKLDVADQVLMNWPAFKEYILTNRKYIRKTLPKEFKW